MSDRLAAWILVIGVLILGMGCRGEEKVNIRLTMAERTELDNRVIATMDTLRPALEARCDELMEERVAAATDSIVQRRLEEELRMRARLSQTIQQ